MTRRRIITVTDKLPPQFDQLPGLASIDVDKGATHAERFAAFHAANPRVYLLLEDMTREMVNRGRTRIGIAMLFEVLRWNFYLHTDDPASEFKLNNTNRAVYARLIMQRHPEWDGLFETREIRAS
jgi:hypothetical protein